MTDDKKAAVTLRIDDEELHALQGATRAARSGSQGLIGETLRGVRAGLDAARRRRCATIDEGDGEGERLLPVAAHELAGRPRPAQRHPAAALPAALRDPAERVRHRPRRPRRGPQRGHPPRQPGAPGDRPGAGDPRQPEPRRWPGWRATRTRRWRRSPASASTFADFIVVRPTRPARPPPSARGDMRRGIHLLPGFLRELRPLMVGPRGLRRPGHAAAAPTSNAAAPDLGRLIKAQGTLADASRKSFPSLGDALERGPPGADPGAAADPGPGQARARRSARRRRTSTSSPRASTRPAAIERINDFLYYVTLSINGFDSLGHYLRAGLVTNVCSTYALEPSRGSCTPNFYDPAAEPSVGEHAQLEAAQRGSGAGSKGKRQRAAHRHACSRACSAQSDPSADRQRERNLEAAAPAAEQRSSPAPRPERADARLPARG